MEDPSCKSNDMARREVGRGWLLWGVPIAVVWLTSEFGGWTAMAVGWPLAFTTMGVACIVNVRRCRRVHCHFTGPFFLLVALASLVHGLRLLPFGDAGWRYIGVGALVGAVVLYNVPELIWGRYFDAGTVAGERS